MTAVKPGQKVKFKKGFSSFRLEGVALARLNDIYYLIHFDDNTEDVVHGSWLLPIVEPADIMKEIL